MQRLPVIVIAFFACLAAVAIGRIALADTTVDPVALVDPFIGTAGDVNDFPGADLPLGMVQWSPDTVSRPPGGGYDYKDASITGFSLTHLSGPGCQAFGDFPMLPVTGPIDRPDRAAAPFAHDHEQASPGYYAVTMDDGVRTELTVTARAGLARMAFPPAATAALIIKAAGSQPGDSDAGVTIDSPAEISGWARNGHFCGSPDEHTVYFDARFDRPMTSFGTWTGSTSTKGSAHAGGPSAGAWASFGGPSADVPITLLVKVGISFTSADEARANLMREIPAWDFDGTRAAAAAAWQTALGRIEIAGGTPAEQRVFYTALYHSLLHPNVFSDADGSYAGFDGRIHHVAPGHVEYANFSGWDIYRTQLPLLALLMPRETSDMVRSLLDAQNEGGWLPKWPLANAYTDAMNGDAADPMIAEAYAFGARDFNARAALAAMVAGAMPSDRPPGQGWFVERPDLREFLAHGYVTNSHTNSVSPLPNSASETLEYSLDDFCIARLARALGDDAVARAFTPRARMWANLFDSSAGLIEPREGDGAFIETPLTSSGQSGFQEGNATQYTWLIPHDTRALFDLMGGDDRVVERLDDFFSQLDAGAGKPYAWLGNEPSLLQPWLYLSARAPWKTQALLRKIETTFYPDAPAGAAGNDDLGAMSAWYVWAAIGFYPQTPGVALLDVGSPLFTRVLLQSEDGRSIDVEAPGAADDAPYVQTMRVNGEPTTRTWFLMPLRGSTHFDIEMGQEPDEHWGVGTGDGPPSYGPAAVHVPPSSPATLAVTPSSLRLNAGQTGTLDLVVSNVRGREPVSVRWSSRTPGLGDAMQSGTLSAPAGGEARATLDVATSAATASGFYDVAVNAEAANGARLHAPVAAVQVVVPRSRPQLAYVMNFSDASVTPIDLRSRTFGPPIAVGANPGDGAVSADGSTLYVADQGASAVSVVDTQRLTSTRTIAVGAVPAGIRMSPDGTTVWVSDYGDDDVRPIDVASGKAGVPIKVGLHPEELAIAPDGRRVYVVDQGSDDVTVVDTQRRAVAGTIPVGRVPLGIALTPDGRWAFVTDIGSNDVIPIDLTSGAVRPAIRVGMAPQQPAVSPDGRTLLVPNSGSNDVTPIDVATLTARAPIHVGEGPFYVMFSPDGATAYVADTGDNACVPIDMRTGKPGAPIDTGNFPIAVVR